MGHSGVRTVGIDLAAQPANTGVCVIDWQAGVVEHLGRNAPGGDDELVAIITGPGVARAGIDTPLGWPDAFIEAVTAHHADRPWPGDDVDPDDHRRTLRLRLTDTDVSTRTGRHPMSVSADRIAVAAMRGARIQTRVRAVTGDRSSVDRSGTSGLVAETYPAAALAVWGLTATGYKGAAEGDRRAAVVEALTVRSGLRLTDDEVTTMVGSDHVLDAFICALVARAVVDGATDGPAPEDLERAQREGWIHVPDPQWCGPGGRLN